MTSNAELWCFSDVRLNKRLHKHWSCRWFDIGWYSFDQFDEGTTPQPYKIIKNYAHVASVNEMLLNCFKIGAMGLILTKLRTVMRCYRRLSDYGYVHYRQKLWNIFHFSGFLHFCGSWRVFLCLKYIPTGRYYFFGSLFPVNSKMNGKVRKLWIWHFFVY